METFRAALGIGASESGLPLPNPRNNIDEWSHNFTSSSGKLEIEMLRIYYGERKMWSSAEIETPSNDR
ncbi:hypothetical protein Godav_029092 [Gossypium davidsonii]|uniref:Uncharacterized protein n=1 Tax=Gossypium davidsonii TaxID=34287 RepID=A0A7J8TK63_GOSDV|nr:hypothetical protein [Gossypium davidsonii]